MNALLPPLKAKKGWDGGPQRQAQHWPEGAPNPTLHPRACAELVWRLP